MMRSFHIQSPQNWMITQFCCFRSGDEGFVRYQDILFYEITSILIAYTQSHVDF